MLVTMLIAFLAGILLGQRFKVMVLLPASGIVLLAIAAQHAHLGRWQTLLVAAAALSCLQIGYLTSHGLRRLAIAARLRRRRAPLAGPSGVLRPSPK